MKDFSVVSLKRENRKLRREVCLLSKENQELQEIVRTDPLTGVYNRRALNDYYPDDKRSISSENWGLLFVDIDNFKKANDDFGHDKGDMALTAIVRIIANNIRLKDVIIRHGGDEFVVILPGSNLQTVERVAKKIESSFRKYCYKPFNRHIKNEKNKVGATIGHAYGDNIFALIKSAETEMRKLKKAKGKGR